MPLDSSIPLQSVAPDPMASLSSMLDVGQKSLSLQKNRATFDADVARSKADSSTAESGAFVANANRGAAVQQATATANTATTGADSAAFGLNQKKTQAAQQGMMELMQNKNINDPDPSTYNHEEAIHTVAGVRDYMISNGQDKAKVESISARLIAAAGQPGGISGIMKQQIRAGLTPSENISASTPSGIGVTNGNDSQVVNTAPLAGKIGSAIPGTQQTAQIPIASQQTPGFDLNGNPIINNRSKTGDVLPPSQMPSGTTAPVIQYPPGYNQAQTPGLLDQANTARASRNKSQEMHSNNKGILGAIDEVLATGPAGGGLAKLAGFTGLAFEGAEKRASAYDTLGKLTERNALAAAAAMGTGTNAQLEAQVKANGSASYNPTALRKITMLSDALQTGVEKYTSGMDKAIAATGHVSAKIKFDELWSKNANVDTLRYLNAVKTKNEKEQTDVLKSAGEPGSPGRLKITQELHNLHKLSQTGAL